MKSKTIYVIQYNTLMRIVGGDYNFQSLNYCEIATALTSFRLEIRYV
jgi:hypothetical protein